MTKRDDKTPYATVFRDKKCRDCKHCVSKEGYGELWCTRYSGRIESTVSIDCGGFHACVNLPKFVKILRKKLDDKLTVR